MKFTLATVLVLAITGDCYADTAGIQNHMVQKLFIEKPCTDALETIDHPPPTPVGIGTMTMAFGFLMGFEAAHPNIRGNYETILIRLRTECKSGSSETAFTMLQRFSTE